MKSFTNTLGKLIGVILLASVFLTGCADSSRLEEDRQTEQNFSSLVANQPIPDLGGYSFERQIVIETLLARNRAINTYTYTLTETGILIEVCASKGYPIPYATQLTSPDQVVYSSLAVSNPEPTGLYPPASAEATYVLCVNPDGSVTPTYWENRIFTLPYRIQADRVLVRDETITSSFSIITP